METGGCLALSNHIDPVVEQMPWASDSSTHTAEEACEDKLFAVLWEIYGKLQLKLAPQTSDINKTKKH